MRKVSTVCLYSIDLKCGMVLVICLGKLSNYNLLSSLRSTTDLAIRFQENNRYKLPDTP